MAEEPSPHGERPCAHPGESSEQPLPLAARRNFNYFSLSMLHRKTITTAPEKGRAILRSISINYAWVNILRPHLTAISILPGAEQAEVALGQTHLSCGLPKTAPCTAAPPKPERHAPASPFFPDIASNRSSAFSPTYRWNICYSRGIFLSLFLLLVSHEDVVAGFFSLFFLFFSKGEWGDRKT